MLEKILTEARQGPVFRLANPGQVVRTLTGMGLDPEGIPEMVSLLQERGLAENPTEVLDRPFNVKRFAKPRQTRFSDGSFGVFYSALEPETAEREIAYWHMKPLLEGQDKPLRAYFQLIKCSFEGDVKDLRPQVEKWPFLIADNGYDECNRLGAEAANSELGGLLSRSARRPEGTTSPVFLRRCLSQVEFLDHRVVDYDPGTGNVTTSSP